MLLWVTKWMVMPFTKRRILQGGMDGFMKEVEFQWTWVQSLGWEDSLDKGMATHFSTLAWIIPWTEEPGGLQSMGSQRGRHDWSNLAHTHTHTHLYSKHWTILHQYPSSLLLIPETSSYWWKVSGSGVHYLQTEAVKWNRIYPSSSSPSCWSNAKHW